MNNIKFLSFIVLLCFLGTNTIFSQTTLPAAAPTIEPEALVAILESPEPTAVLIFNTGPVNVIKNAINVGAVEDKKNIKKLKKLLRKVPKDQLIVYYCGCCPFATCPNLLPAAKLLESMKFTNFKALNLPKSLKIDWMDKSYPMKED